MGESSATKISKLFLITLPNTMSAARAKHILRLPALAERLPNILEEGASPCPQRCSFFNRSASEGWCLEGHPTGSSRQPAIFKEDREPLRKWKVLISTCCKAACLHPKTQWGYSFSNSLPQPPSYRNCWRPGSRLLPFAGYAIIYNHVLQKQPFPWLLVVVTTCLTP